MSLEKHGAMILGIYREVQCMDPWYPMGNIMGGSLVSMGKHNACILGISRSIMRRFSYGKL